MFWMSEKLARGVIKNSEVLCITCGLSTHSKTDQIGKRLGKI